MFDWATDGGAGPGKSSQRLFQIEAVIEFFVVILIVIILALLVFAIFGAPPGVRLHFFVWACVVGAGSLASGVALGLLFGLPPVRSINIVGTVSADGKPSRADRNATLGYSENTSLEQIADWLTKIIIGLTLTQYESWESRFAVLSCNVTRSLLPTQTPSVTICGFGSMGMGETIPGGFLMLVFATLGFLLSYLWMRAHFISEMEAAKSNAIAKAAQNDIDDMEKQLLDKDATLAKANADLIQRNEQISEKDRVLAQKAAELEMKEAALQEASARADQFQRELKAKQEQGLGQSRTVAGLEAVQQMVKQGAARVGKDAREIAAEIADLAKSPQFPDDPWRGLFGGKESDSGLTLTGSITEHASNSDWFDVRLVVTQDDNRDPKIGSVQFYLHPTFGGEIITVSFGADGKAPLDLIAYGAFTVGVLAEDGTTLELNLANVPEVNAAFLAR